MTKARRARTSSAAGEKGFCLRYFGRMASFAGFNETSPFRRANSSACVSTVADRRTQSAPAPPHRIASYNASMSCQFKRLNRIDPKVRPSASCVVRIFFAADLQVTIVCGSSSLKPVLDLTDVLIERCVIRASTTPLTARRGCSARDREGTWSFGNDRSGGLISRE